MNRSLKNKKKTQVFKKSSDKNNRAKNNKLFKRCSMNKRQLKTIIKESNVNLDSYQIYLFLSNAQSYKHNPNLSYVRFNAVPLRQGSDKYIVETTLQEVVANFSEPNYVIEAVKRLFKKLGEYTIREINKRYDVTLGCEPQYIQIYYIQFYRNLKRLCECFNFDF